MHYAIRRNVKARLSPGDLIEILESFYNSGADEILVERFRCNGRTFLSRPIAKSGPGMMPVKPHEGYVEGIRESDQYTFLKINPAGAGKEL